MSWMNGLGTLVMISGAFFVVVAAVGTIKFPDVYCRSHALSKALTLGIMLLLIGYGLRTPDVSWIKLTLIVIFQFVTIPVASHLFSYAAYKKGIRGWSP